MMETKQYTTIDRAALKWPSGPWDDECDKAQWPDAETGLPCLAVRHPQFGHWCGYVGVAASHPLFGEEDFLSVEVDVHGGNLTFANECEPHEKEADGICHVPAPGEPDEVWWFGFDCAHCWDAAPYQFRFAGEFGGPFHGILKRSNYRTLAFVRRECARLARQLFETFEA